MPAKICYLGDDHLAGAAAYLAGIMLHDGLSFDHVRSDQSPPADFSDRSYALYVVSDYPAARFGDAAMKHVAARVERGAGLAMFGGWESYHGRLGEYHRSPLVDVLPVVMQESDDRRNHAQPCLINKVAEHPILGGVPWETPPDVGGWNAVEAKPNAQTLLTAVQFSVRRAGDDFQFVRGHESPLLVVGQCGRGRTAALATDVAPHWVGGFVDWGDRRIAQAVGDGFVEVGNWYATFFRNLLVWTGQLSSQAEGGGCQK
ncbi:MAG: glutamine amidotransferase [Planctomycetaceae bacterium]|nr:glutamine amidotransferase [Planctomycetaceae bacterium]